MVVFVRKSTPIGSPVVIQGQGQVIHLGKGRLPEHTIKTQHVQIYHLQAPPSADMFLTNGNSLQS